MTAHRWTYDEIPDLTGQTAIVTGASSGIGTVEARELAKHGAHVVLAVRNVDAGRQVAERVAAAAGRGDTPAVRHLDLASLASVGAFAAETDHPVDLLVNNAGVMYPPRWTATQDGHELQFGTNHLGHFALTGLLLPRLLDAPAPRVTTVASIAHRHGDADVVEGNPRAGYSPQRAYGRSKLANLMFALELERRATEAGARLTSNAAHPGISTTGLMTDREGMGASGVVRAVAPYVMRLLFPGPEQGAEAILYAATVAGPGTYTGPQHLGESRGPVGPAKMSQMATNTDLARLLWERSEELTGVTYRWS